jgi:hypothetical protein
LGKISRSNCAVGKRPLIYISSALEQAASIDSFVNTKEGDRLKLPIFDLSTSINSADSFIKLIQTIFLLITTPV